MFAESNVHVILITVMLHFAPQLLPFKTIPKHVYNPSLLGGYDSTPSDKSHIRQAVDYRICAKPFNKYLFLL